MAIDPTQVFRDALQLPDEDRARLAGQLIESLDQEGDEDVVPAWAEEIAQRLRDIDQGKVTPVPWDTARRIIRES